MKDDKLTIGQMAKLNHTSPSTLRFYEKLGLLAPDYTDSKTGYRYYDVLQSTIIRAIQYNTNLDVSMKELQEVREAADFKLVTSLYRQKLQAIEETLQQLEMKKQTLYKAIEWVEHYRHLPPAGTMTLEFLPAGYVYTRPAQKNYFQEDFRAYIHAILKLLDHMEQNRIPERYQYFTGFTLKLEDYQADNFLAVEEQVYVDACYAGYPHVKKRPGQLCACMYVEGFSKLSDGLQALKKACREHHCVECGDVSCRLLGSLDPEDFRTPRAFLRLQVPVRMEQKV